MPGFPLTPSRDTFGPTLEEWGKVRNPKREIGQATWNLTFWQLAAISQLIPIARVELAAADGARVASAEGWNPNGSVGLKPACARTGTGVYTVTYAATYADEPTANNPNGVQRPFVPRTGRVTVRGVDGGVTSDRVGIATVVGQVITVRTTIASSGNLVDAPFLLEVFT